jgi:hypothetical protein
LFMLSEVEGNPSVTRAALRSFEMINPLSETHPTLCTLHPAAICLYCLRHDERN